MKKRLRQLLKFMRLVGRWPSAAVALVRWKPFSITSFETLRHMEEQGIRPATVIDGGANIGQFARAALETFGEASIISFEPHPMAAGKFRQNLGTSPRCRLVAKALGNVDGTVTFFPQEYDLASSVLQPVDEVSVAAIEVPITRLDTELVPEELRKPVLLKLDLQGYELEALKGAMATLECARWVLAEISLRPSYEGEATFDQIHEFLRDRGFRFLRPVDLLTAENGEIVQMDVLFERRG